MSIYGRLSAAQLTTLQTELQTDPRSLGYAPFVTTSDYVNLALLLNFVRDGATACPVNGVVGPSGAITGATNASPIQITSTAHGLKNNDSVLVSGVGGNTAANGTWVITKVDANNFTLNGSTGSGAFTSGGSWQWCVSNVRAALVPAAAILGAIDNRDLPGNGSATAVTGDQSSGLLYLVALCNQPSGSVAFTDATGADNNVAKNLKRIFNGATHGTLASVTALETRAGGAAEAKNVLNLAGTATVSQNVGGSPFSFSNLLDQFDVRAALLGSYS